MAQALRYSQDISAIADQKRGHCVPELVRMYRREVVPLGKAAQPLRYVVGVHGPAVVSREHIPALDPAVAILETKTVIVCPVQTEELHGFLRDLDEAGFAGLGTALIDPTCRGIQECPVDAELLSFPVDGVPVEAHDFPSSAAGDNQKVSDRLPFDGLLFQTVHYPGQFVRLEAVDFGALNLWGRRTVRGIVLYEHFFFGLSHDCGDQPVIFQDRFGRKGTAILLGIDQMTEMIFEMLAPRIDRDSERYEETKEQRRFAVYCREEKRKGNEPLTFEEWRIRTPSAIERYPTPISALSPSPASKATTTLSTAKNAPGEGWRGEEKNNSEALSFPLVYQKQSESDFVKLRDSKIESVKQYGKMN